MKFKTETGHAKNVANFERLIQFCRSYNGKYNPSAENISIMALEKLLARAEKSLAKSTNAQDIFDKATNRRAQAFENNRKYATRIANAFAVCGADQRAIDDVNGVNRRIQGKRSGELPDPAAKLKEGEETPKTISVSQASYDNQRKHFTRLCDVLSLEEKYMPNEPDLKIDAIKAKLNEMNATNTSLGEMDTHWSAARIERDAIMYAPLTGLVAISKAVKKYLKSAYTATHPNFVQVNEIPFRIIKGK